MLDPTQLPVTHPTGQYAVMVGADLLPNLAQHAGIHGPIALITDSNVGPLHAARCGDVACLVTIPAGEQHKTLATVQTIYDQLLTAGIDRQATVVALGGGVVGDVAGFVAATYMRGVDFVQCPTSLLAMVDASVGGKTGVDLPQGKNLVGAFKQPTAVLADITTLQTLPPVEFAAGMAEVVKYGVILDAEFFAYLEANIDGLNSRDDGVLRTVIARSCQLKADVVEQDERETTGIRAALNYGHTYAHAFETLCVYGQMLHGEAVAVGMLCASRLAERLGRITTEDTARQFRLLQALELPTAPPKLDENEVLAVMRRDKKATAGRLRFILPTKLGHVELVDGVAAEDALAGLVEGAS